MKRSAKLLTLALISLLLINSFAFASGNKEVRHLTYDSIELNLLNGLKSDNLGLRISSAYMLGEIKSTEAVLPLTQMLRDAKDCRARLTAAISLIKIGSDRSTFVVKQGIQFNDYEKVRKLCEHLYYAYLQGDIEENRIYENDMLAQLFTH